MKYLLLAVSMLLSVTGQLLLKKGVISSSLSFELIPILRTIFSPFIILGLSSYALSAIFWLFVLQRFQLSVAYPALSLTYILIVLLGFFFFKEPVTTAKILGVILVVSGVFLIFQ